MAILPLTTASSSSSASSFGRLPGLGEAGGGSSRLFSSGRAVGLGRTWRRLGKWPSLDFELAIWQLTYLLIAPRRVYRNVYYHKQTKNKWARDDPTVSILISLALCACAIGWGIYYRRGGWGTLGLMVRMVTVDYLAVGMLVSTAFWAFSNALLLHSPHSHAPMTTHVEWAYAFDVHTNSFFPFLLVLYFAQLILAPVVTRREWVCLWTGNTLYLVAFLYYTFITYQGYNTLPFLIRTELLLILGFLAIIAYILSLLGLNVASAVLGWYFGSGVGLA